MVMTASRRLFPGRLRPSGFRRTTGLLVATAAATSLLVGPGLSPAAAHDGLVSSIPAPGSAVPTAPSAVELTFTAPPLTLGTQVVVTGPDGITASSGEPEFRDAVVVQPLDGSLPAGEYTVQWRAASSDGHPITGTHAFTVTEGEAADTAAAQPAPGRPAGDGVPVGWLAAGALALGGGGVLVTRRLRGRA
jgi:methionine-rich copper-binding protein CopC